MRDTLLQAAQGDHVPRRGTYVPQLQDHAGERRAWSQLRFADRELLKATTPLIQIVGGNKRELTRPAVHDHVKRIVEALGTAQPMYLDFLRAHPGRTLDTPQGPASTAEVAYSYARRNGLRFVPVVSTKSPAAHLAAASNVAIFDGCGVALRHKIFGTAAAGGASLDEVLSARVEELRVETKEIDLLLDMDYLDEDVQVSSQRILRLVDRAARVGAWRRVVLSGSSIPKTLKCVPDGSTGLLDRREWRIWQELPKEHRAGLDFGDFGIQHPTPPKEGGPGMRANIRYTTADGHLIVRGVGPMTDQGAAQYVGLCQRLMESGEFFGSEYSWGDEMIERCASLITPPSSQNFWRAAGTAHHVRVLIEQLAETE